MAQLSIGLDIGHHQVRAVALSRPTSAQARAGAVAKIVATAAVPRHDHDGQVKPMLAALGEIEALLSTRGALTVHLGDASTMVRFVPTLPLPPDRRQRLLRLELTQHADDAGDLAADAWEVAVPGDEIVHGCVISQPAHVLAGLQALRTARLGSARISYGPAAIANTAFAAHLATDGEMVLVVDIGATITGISLLGDQRLLACRQVQIGGEAFTEALMASGLDRRAAEKSKVTSQPASVVGSAASLGTTISTAISETSIETVMFVEGSDADGSASIAGADLVAEPTRKRVADAAFDALFEEDSAPLAGSASAPLAENEKKPRAITEKLADFDADAGQLGISLDDHIVLELDDDHSAPANATSFSSELPPQLAALLPSPGMATISLGRKALGPELQRAAEALYAQLASSVLWFRSQLRLEELPIARVYLTGGGSALENLDTYLQRRFNCPVAILDPFQHLVPGSESVRMPSDGPAWATVIGLALATPALAGSHAVILDLRPESLIRADFYKRHQVWPYIAAGLLVAASVVGGLVLHNHQVANEASLAAYADWKTKREDLIKQLATLDSEKNAQAEDLRSIAGRIYAGRDLLFAVRALKELAITSPELWITRYETRGVSAVETTKESQTTAPVPTKGYDTAVDRGTLLLSGRVKFDAAPTDTKLDQFLKTWREALVQWKPAPDAPLLFMKQRVVEWDPNHKSKSARPGGAKPVAEGEFPFKIEFTFPPTQLDQITAAHTGPEAPAGQQKQ